MNPIQKIAITFAALCVTHTLYAAEPENLSITKQNLMQYQSSGEYARDLKRVADEAKAYLKARIASPHEKPLAIVFDIDETCLSNYRDMVTLSFGGSLPDILREEAKGTDAAIPATLELYQYALANKVAVFFVTGRIAQYREPTVKNLKAEGFSEWEDLIFKPSNYHEKTVSIYKAGERKAITNKGYDIVIDIGDQDSDLAGGYADKTFKLPNPFYFLP